jgi:hypothetical protein
MTSPTRLFVAAGLIALTVGANSVPVSAQTTTADQRADKVPIVRPAPQPVENLPPVRTVSTMPTTSDVQPIGAADGNVAGLPPVVPAGAMVQDQRYDNEALTLAPIIRPAVAVQDAAPLDPELPPIHSADLLPFNSASEPVPTSPMPVAQGDGWLSPQGWRHVPSTNEPPMPAAPAAMNYTSSGPVNQQQPSPSDIIVEPQEGPHPTEPVPLGNGYFYGPGGQVTYGAPGGSPPGGIGVDVQVDYGAGALYGDQGSCGNGEDPCYGDGCGFVCGSTRYTLFDYLLWQREGGVVFTPPFQGVNDWTDESQGGRVTIGRRDDCTHGREFSFFSFDHWVAETQQSAPPLMNVPITAIAIPITSFGSFFNLTSINQFQESDLTSLEFNQVWWGWDVAKIYWGIRMIDFEDEYLMTTQNFFGAQGVYAIDLDNRLIGAHIGSEWFYDVGRLWSYSSYWRVGGYANAHDGSTTIINNNTTVIAASSEDVEFSASVEVGAAVHVVLGPRLRVRVGYEILSLIDVFTVEENFSTLITPITGQQYSNSDNALFHGAFAGVEFYR